MVNQLEKFKRSAARKQRQFENGFCFLNFKTYLKETTLHGLRFIGDEKITIWERGFFLFATIAALVVTGHLIFFIYAKWQSTPILIGVNPYATSISEIPFPAITICNMNQLLKSKVSHYPADSPEGALIKIACVDDVHRDAVEIPENFKNNNLSFVEFFAKNGQSCKSMLRSCILNSNVEDCSKLFHDTIADEGSCCVFNSVHPFYRFKNNYRIPNNDSNKAVAVDWSPEFGYPKNLPSNYYPRPARGIGVSMGLTLVLDAEHDEYLCSSANGAGFKLALNNPIETPRVKENGIIIGVGVESRYSIDAHNYVAAPNIRPLGYSSRKCLFADEGELIYYKYYTRLNCENECQSRHVYRRCGCIPFNLPLIFPNATVCGASHNFCMRRAQNFWLRSLVTPCRRKCLNSCFDYTYVASAYTSPLVQGHYRVQNDLVLRNMSRKYIRENIVVLHFFFREFIFHGNTRNVYIGLTEFLSNVGGVMSLFLGFSFISLAEIFYYACMRPFFWWLKSRNIQRTNGTSEVPDTGIWLGDEIMHTRRQPAWKQSALWKQWSYQKGKNEILNFKTKGFYRSSIATKTNKHSC